MTIASSTDVFFDQLEDLRSATEQTRESLPDLIEWARDTELKSVFETYATTVSRHLQEILAMFDAHSKEPGDDICKAIAGLIEGGNKHIEMAADTSVRGLLLIAHTNRMAHYLQAAAEFTLAIAIQCGLSAEADAVAGILTEHRDFRRSLAKVGTETFNIGIGGVK